jgi:hypothetical protein
MLDQFWKQDILVMDITMAKWMPLSLSSSPPLSLYILRAPEPQKNIYALGFSALDDDF